MAISVILRGEDRTDLGSISGPYEPLVDWLERVRFPILGHIDRYGDTILNSGQMQTLLAELEELERISPELIDRETETVAQLRELCKVGIKRPHSYLWFLGD